jgi:hypothetical protein
LQIGEARELVALRMLDKLDSRHVVAWASEQLAASNTLPPALVELGCLPSHADSRDVDRLLGEYLSSVGAAVATQEEAGLIVAKRLARQILDGSLDPATGARRIWWDVVARLPALHGQLSPFVGLASEWEDHPDYRAEYELDILNAARQLLGDAEPGHD